jgi:hypothetical protein
MHHSPEASAAGAPQSDETPLRLDAPSSYVTVIHRMQFRQSPKVENMCKSGRLTSCAHCAASIDPLSPIFFLNDEAFCSETHRVLALTAAHHGEAPSVDAKDANAVFRRSDSTLGRAGSFRRVESAAVGRQVQRICTGVGLRRFMRTWL